MRDIPGKQIDKMGAEGKAFEVSTFEDELMKVVVILRKEVKNNVKHNFFPILSNFTLAKQLFFNSDQTPHFNIYKNNNNNNN